MTARTRGRSRPVHGEVAPGFEPFADTFRDQLERGRSIGAACAVFRDGEPVVDLWGGERDGDRGLPWDRDTVVPVFSTAWWPGVPVPRARLRAGSALP